MAAAGSAPAVRRLGEFGEFLTSRRARLQPADVGLPDGTRRRTPGLRREEVAQLAGVSPTYYAFLEQGRDISPSSQVLDALARALRLSPAERDHLYTLAQRGAPPGAGVPETLGAGITALVDRLDPYPTFVKGRRWDILAANRAARALFTDWLALPPGQRNELLWMFTDPGARETYAAAAHKRAPGGAATMCFPWPAGPSGFATRCSARSPSTTWSSRSLTIPT